MSDKPMEAPPDDPIEARIRAEADRAVARYEGICPPEMLEEMRRLMRLGLRTHPAFRQMLRRTVPAPTLSESNKMATGALGVTPGAVADLPGAAPESPERSAGLEWNGASIHKRGGGAA